MGNLLGRPRADLLQRFLGWNFADTPKHVTLRCQPSDCCSGSGKLLRGPHTAGELHSSSSEPLSRAPGIRRAVQATDPFLAGMVGSSGEKQM